MTPTADLPPDLPADALRYTVPDEAPLAQLGTRRLGERFAVAPVWALNLLPVPPAIRTRRDWLVAELAPTDRPGG